jgi:hypothetical protein
MQVYVYQSSELVTKFDSNYYDSQERFSASVISEAKAEEAYVKLVSHLIELVGNSSEDKFRSDISRILFSLDHYFIQIFKYSYEGEEFMSFECAHKELYKESGNMPESLIVIDGGGLKFWSVSYNISKSEFNQIKVNSPW